MSAPVWVAVRATATVLPHPGWLDAVEMARRDELRQPADRDRFTASRAVLKSLVGELAGCDPERIRLTYDCPTCARQHGRPVVVDPLPARCWQVSLTHAGAYVAAAASRLGPVGIDVESIAATGFSGFDAVALTPDERQLVDALPEARRAAARARCWVRAEARLKARLDPLHPAVRDLDVDDAHAGAVAVRTDQAWEVRPASGAGRAMTRGEPADPAEPAVPARAATG